MTVWIVIVNGQVDEVFADYHAAELHRKNMQRKWSLTSLVEKVVKEL